MDAFGAWQGPPSEPPGKLVKIDSFYNLDNHIFAMIPAAPKKKFMTRARVSIPDSPTKSKSLKKFFDELKSELTTSPDPPPVKTLSFS